MNLKALNAAMLAQYQNSEAFMERFLEAIHTDDAEIQRSLAGSGFQLIDGREHILDAHEYFTSKKPALEQEFLAELTEGIGADKAKYFCDVIAVDWYKGGDLRKGPRVQDIKRSVMNYLKTKVRGRPLSDFVIHSETEMNSYYLEKDDITFILAANYQMLHRHTSAWLDKHPRGDRMGESDVFFRRGLSLDALPDTTGTYREWDYINSYSMAFSVPEKFSNLRDKPIQAIVNADLSLLRNRFLFFSPFIPGMPLGQLEAGIIPADEDTPIFSQEEHGGIHEFILGEQPPFRLEILRKMKGRGRSNGT